MLCIHVHMYHVPYHPNAVLHNHPLSGNQLLDIHVVHSLGTTLQYRQSDWTDPVLVLHYSTDSQTGLIQYWYYTTVQTVRLV